MCNLQDCHVHLFPYKSLPEHMKYINSTAKRSLHFGDYKIAQCRIGTLFNRKLGTGKSSLPGLHKIKGSKNSFILLISVAIRKKRSLLLIDSKM